MGSDYFTRPVEFLLTTLIELYVLAILLRFLLASVRADFYNPVSQFLVRVTNPVIVPLRRLLPPAGRVDTATITAMIGIEWLGQLLVGLLRGGVQPWVGFVVTLATLTEMVFNVFLFAIVIQAILSWISPGTWNPVVSIIHSLAEPVLRPFRRLLPPVSGIDLSPLLAILAIMVAKMLILPLFGVLLR